MQVLATRWFSRFATGERISDAALCEVVVRAESGLVEADLGGGLFEARVGQAGQGRRGGYRVLFAFRSGERTVFLYGFAKSERDNIGEDDLADWRLRARQVLAASKKTIVTEIAEDRMREFDCGT